MTGALLQRIQAKLVPVGDCLVWTGTKVGAGYGVISAGRRTTRGTYVRDYVHRLMYEHHKGPIPEDLEIDHLCRVKLCANPDHLEAVTHAENRRRARLEQCQHGHPFDEANTYVQAKSGKRYCRRCSADRAARYRQRKVAA